MTKECPSCGNIVENGQLFCPMCGTKLISGNSKQKKQPNQELESLLFTANANAEVALAKKLGAGLIGSNHFEDLKKLEEVYLEIIQRFPTEAKPYIAYTDYMIKFILKINSLTNIFATTQYFIGDLDLTTRRCKDYLQKAKQFADDDELEQILQLDSTLSSDIEAIANDKSIKSKQKKNQAIAKWCMIGVGILFGVLIIIWIIAEIATS